jgi:hypothetical protein
VTVVAGFAYVGSVLQEPQYGDFSPSWLQNKGVHPTRSAAGHCSAARAIGGPLENLPNHGGLGFVDHELAAFTVDLPKLTVSKSTTAPYDQALPRFLAPAAAGPFAGLLALVFRNHSLDLDETLGLWSIGRWGDHELKAYIGAQTHLAEPTDVCELPAEAVRIVSHHDVHLP